MHDYALTIITHTYIYTNTYNNPKRLEALSMFYWLELIMQEKIIIPW